MDEPLPPDAAAPGDGAGAAPGPHGLVADEPPADRHIERRAAALLLALLGLIVASGAYLLYARGVFEPMQKLVLVAEDSEGVSVGMPVTFSGFVIGRVQRIGLVEDGSVRIDVEVPRKEAHWLRTSSVFTLSRGLVGNTAIRAYSGILADPPLPDGAVRKVLSGDASAEVPKLMSQVRELLANLTAMTSPDGALAATLGHAQVATSRLAGPQGALAMAMGNSQDAAKVTAALDHANRLLLRLEGLAQRTDGLVGRADAQVFGPQGLANDAKAAAAQVQALLADVRGNLKKVDGLLDEAQGVARNARVATTDLGQLRAEVEASLRKVESLVNEINRKWPLARDTEVKLP